MSHIRYAVVILVALLAQARAEEMPPVEDLQLADQLLFCAAAHGYNIRIAQETGQESESLVKYVAYFLSAGEAFSNLQYAQLKASQLKEEVSKKMTVPFSVPKSEQLPKARELVTWLHKQLNECGELIRKNGDAIEERRAKAGSARK